MVDRKNFLRNWIMKIGENSVGKSLLFGTYVSYKTKIYTHKSYSTGNTPSGYCEKQVTTWYSQKNYTGTSVTTIQFKNGYLY